MKRLPEVFFIFPSGWYVVYEIEFSHVVKNSVHPGVQDCLIYETALIDLFPSFQGEAEKAGVDLVSVERGTTQPLPGELTDATAQHLIRFDNLNPFTYTDRSCVVKNVT